MYIHPKDKKFLGFVALSTIFTIITQMILAKVLI